MFFCRHVAVNGCGAVMSGHPDCQIRQCRILIPIDAGERFNTTEEQPDIEGNIDHCVHDKATGHHHVIDLNGGRLQVPQYAYTVFRASDDSQRSGLYAS
mgnify:CR=1 FL=1